MSVLHPELQTHQSVIPVASPSDVGARASRLAQFLRKLPIRAGVAPDVALGVTGLIQ
jgi:hypothetical protein